MAAAGAVGRGTVTFSKADNPIFHFLKAGCEPRLPSGPGRGQASVEQTNQNESRINSRFTRDGVSLVAAVGPLTLNLYQQKFVKNLFFKISTKT